MKVLVVEDDPLLARLIAQYLRPIADEIVIALTMADAMREVAKVPPFDLVTLDLNLPDSVVAQTLERIAEIKAHNEQALVIVITGMMQIENSELALAAGADGFLHKSEFRGGEHGTLRAIRDVVMAAIRQPRRYQRNVALLEQLTGRIAEYLTALTPPPEEHRTT